MIKSSMLKIIVPIVMSLVTLSISQASTLLSLKKENLGKNLTFEWENQEGNLVSSEWIDDGNKYKRYKKITDGCGLPSMCRASRISVTEFNDHKCLLIKGDNGYSKAGGRSVYYPEHVFTTSNESNCNIHDKLYWLEDVSSQFTFTDNAVRPKNSNFRANDYRRSYFNYDVSNNGSKIITTLYDGNSIRSGHTSNNTVFYFNLETKKAFQIVFPFAEKIYAGFIDKDDFLIKLKLKDEAEKNASLRKSVGTAYGVLYRFNKDLVSKPVETPHDRLCGGDIITFDVTQDKIYFSTSDVGVCGDNGYSVVGKFLNEYEIQTVKYNEMGETDGLEKNIDEVNLLNYGSLGCRASQYNDECNLNNSFFKISNKGDQLLISKIKYKNKPLNEEVPENDYLFPVWMKSYDGLTDVSASIKTNIVDNKFLEMSITVTDDILITSNSNHLNNDHIELWFYSNPTILSGVGKSTYDNKIKTVGLSHFLVSSGGVVSLLDKQRYRNLGLGTKMFKPVIKGIKSSFTMTKQGYKQVISVPLDKLPFYQLTNYSQCLNIMVDVIDVDSSNKQEALLSTNIHRKWGDTTGFTEFCFSFEDYSESKVLINQGLSVNSDDGNYAILINENSRLKPYQYSSSKKKLIPFISEKSIIYKKLKLIKLPPNETEKIVLSNVDELCKAVEDAYYSRENNSLFILSKCSYNPNSVQLSVLDLSNDKLLLIPFVTYNSACYRHCVEKFFEYDYSNIEYGMLDKSIHIVKVDNAQFFFSKNKNIWGEHSINESYNLLVKKLSPGNNDIANFKTITSNDENLYKPTFTFKEPINVDGLMLKAE